MLTILTILGLLNGLVLLPVLLSLIGPPAEVSHMTSTGIIESWDWEKKADVALYFHPACGPQGPELCERRDQLYRCRLCHPDFI